MNEKQQKIYWKGVDAGKKKSLKHNINLMKLQLKAMTKSKEIKK